MADNPAGDDANGEPEASAAARPAPQKPSEQRSARGQPLRGQTLQDVEAFRALLPAQGRLIGVDAGTKTLGLALSDVTRMIASPLETIWRTRFKADAAHLLKLAGDHAVAGLVIGFPVNMDGSEGPRAQATRALARNLNLINDLPILLWDERLSTAAAERTLLEADASRRRRAEVVDKLAATIILQGALDRMRRSPG